MIAPIQIIINATLKNIRAYKARFIPDSGVMKSDSTTKAYYALLKKHSIPEPAVCLIAESAYKPRVSGINSFFTKMYSLYATNDATQTTELSQPNLSGNIAPNEKLCLSNANG